MRCEAATRGFASGFAFADRDAHFSPLTTAEHSHGQLFADSSAQRDLNVVGVVRRLIVDLHNHIAHENTASFRGSVGFDREDHYAGPLIAVERLDVGGRERYRMQADADVAAGDTAAFQEFRGHTTDGGGRD